MKKNNTYNKYLIGAGIIILILIAVGVGVYGNILKTAANPGSTIPKCLTQDLKDLLKQNLLDDKKFLDKYTKQADDLQSKIDAASSTKLAVDLEVLTASMMNINTITTNFAICDSYPAQCPYKDSESKKEAQESLDDYQQGLATQMHILNSTKGLDAVKADIAALTKALNSKAEWAKNLAYHLELDKLPICKPSPTPTPTKKPSPTPTPTPTKKPTPTPTSTTRPTTTPTPRPTTTNTPYPTITPVK